MKRSKGGDVARWLEMVGERGRGGSTAQGLRAEFIPLDKVAPHPPPSSHVGLIPWDKLAEPACLRITSPRYTLAYGRPVVYTNLNRPRCPFCDVFSNSRKLATNRCTFFGLFSFARILYEADIRDKPSEQANLR